MDIETTEIGTDNIQKELLKHCKELMTIAKAEAPIDRLKKFEKYYYGRFDSKQPAATPAERIMTNAYNIIKPIVDTKNTFILDSYIKTSVEPTIFSFADMQQVQKLDDIADILDSCLQHVFKINMFDSIADSVLNKASINGLGIVKVFIDPSLSHNMGDVKLECIDPKRFFPDPNGTKIENCNYIVVEVPTSVFDLKKKYPDRLEDIDRLVSKSTSKDNASLKNADKNEVSTNRVQTVRDENNSSQLYVNQGGSNLDKQTKTINLYEVYFKDDSTFAESPDDTEKESESKQVFKALYPNGRCVIFSDDVLFEDKPIDYPFGFPFEVLNYTETDDIWGQGQVEDLIGTQEALTKAYYRRRMLIAKYISILLVDPTIGITQETQFINQWVIIGEPGTMTDTMIPKVLTNNTLSEIENLNQYITLLKNDAKEIARINDMMLTGMRPEGVNSGTMVESLNESPMAGIRSIQRTYKDFLVSLSQKILTLIIKYYPTNRFIRLMDGKQFAVLNPGNIRLMEELQGQYQNVKDIKMDINITDYEVSVVSGAEMPKSKQAIAAITMSLAEQGVLGKMGSIQTNRRILQAYDYPNYRAIIAEQQAEQEEQMKNQPSPLASLIDKLALSFKDLPIPAKLQVLDQLNIKVAPESLVDEERMENFPKKEID